MVEKQKKVKQDLQVFPKTMCYFQWKGRGTPSLLPYDCKFCSWHEGHTTNFSSSVWTCLFFS